MRSRIFYRVLIRIAAVWLLTALCLACGQKGPLKLPDAEDESAWNPEAPAPLRIA